MRSSISFLANKINIYCRIITSAQCRDGILYVDEPRDGRFRRFDWPGNQGSTLRGYRRALGIARQSGTDLARLIALIIDDVRPERLWLVANSMGAQVVSDAFSVLYREARFSDTETEIEDVVLTAPDVSREDFDTNFKPKIKALVKELTG